MPRSWTTTGRGRQMTKKLKPMHPGEVLREEFLVPLKMSAGALAKVCGVPRTRIERIASEQTGITADTALRLGKALGTTAQLWLNLQIDHDVQVAKRDLGKVLDRIETVTSRRRPSQRSTISQGIELGRAADRAVIAPRRSSRCPSSSAVARLSGIEKRRSNRSTDGGIAFFECV